MAKPACRKGRLVDLSNLMSLQIVEIAQMAKLVDALPSGGSVRKDVLVRIQFWAQYIEQNLCISIIYRVVLLGGYLRGHLNGFN